MLQNMVVKELLSSMFVWGFFLNWTKDCFVLTTFFETLELFY